MADPNKLEALPSRKHTVIWDAEDWKLLEEAAAILAERTHLEVETLDIIRAGARKFAEDVKAGRIGADQRVTERSPSRRAGNHVESDAASS